VTQTSEATSAADKPARTKKSGGLSSMLLPELKQLASSLGIKGTGAMRKSALVDAITAAQASTPGAADQSAPTSHPAAAEPSSAPTESGQTWQRQQTQTPAAQLRSDTESAANQRSQAEPAVTQRYQPESAQPSTEPASAPFTTQEMNGEFDGAERTRSAPTSEAVPDRLADAATFEGNGRTRDDGSGRSRDAGNGRPRDAGQTQQSREGRSDQAARSQDRNRDRNRDPEDRLDAGQDRDAGLDGRDHGQDGGPQSRDVAREHGQQAREGGQRDNQTGRDGYRDDDRGGSRNSRRRNRNRDRFRDRDKRRDGNESEPQVSEDDVLIPAAGILDLLDNYAFVRTSGYLPGPNDVYVALSMVRKYGLRKGDAVTGAVRQQATDGERREKFNPMVRIDTVNGAEPEASRNRIEFSKLIPLYAQERLRLETEPTTIATRIIDIVAPIGKGQRGLIVSPSKAGKTLILQAMANAITTNNPECHLMVVLVDERPEEVTDMQRAVKGEVIASTFDRPAEDHTTVAELAIERAKRLVELGHDLVVLLDSITRLGRAYNLAAPASGRILSGGVDSSALYPPKRFFGAARNIEDGGSLTILATALIETGSKMDEVIFEEFKGTGNMELRLRREFADKRIFPAIDVDSSGTRREELLMSRDELQVVWKLRRVLSALDGQQALELILEKLKKTKSNVEFLMQVRDTMPMQGNSRGRDDG
jgi:transcription termination factor Rho